VDFPSWWFNLRKSNTEPLLRLVLEASTAQELARRTAELKETNRAIDPSTSEV
jgi:phosphomannomutase